MGGMEGESNLPVHQPAIDGAVGNSDIHAIYHHSMSKLGGKKWLVNVFYPQTFASPTEEIYFYYKL